MKKYLKTIVLTICAAFILSVGGGAVKYMQKT